MSPDDLLHIAAPIRPHALRLVQQAVTRHLEYPNPRELKHSVTELSYHPPTSSSQFSEPKQSTAAMGPLRQCMYQQFFVTPAYPTTDCTGRTIIVTGANTGLGKEAVRHLVQLNAERVILTSRVASKGEAAAKDIEQTTGRKGVVEVWDLDLESSTLR